jgi:hypothetical protein
MAEELPEYIISEYNDETVETNGDIETSISLSEYASPNATPLDESPAQDFEINGSGVITKYLGTGGYVVIPEEIDGITVTSVSETSFQNNKNIIKLTLPRTLTSVPHSSTNGSFSGSNIEELFF